MDSMAIDACIVKGKVSGWWFQSHWINSVDQPMIPTIGDNEKYQKPPTKYCSCLTIIVDYYPRLSTIVDRYKTANHCYWRTESSQGSSGHCIHLRFFLPLDLFVSARSAASSESSWWRSRRDHLWVQLWLVLVIPSYPNYFSPASSEITKTHLVKPISLIKIVEMGLNHRSKINKPSVYQFNQINVWWFTIKKRLALNNWISHEMRKCTIHFLHDDGWSAQVPVEMMSIQPIWIIIGIAKVGVFVDDATIDLIGGWHTPWRHQWCVDTDPAIYGGNHLQGNRGQTTALGDWVLSLVCAAINLHSLFAWP